MNNEERSTLDVVFVWASRVVKFACLLIFLWHLFQKLREILTFSSKDNDLSADNIDLRDGVLHGVDKLEHEEEERRHAK